MATDVGLAPSRLTIELPPGGTIVETVTIFATGADPELMEVELSDFTLDISGNLAFLPAGVVQYSSTPWITLEAGSVEVAPDIEREFRFTVQVPEDADVSGTHHGMIFFTTEATAAPEQGAGVQVRNRLALPVYVTVSGTENPAGTIVDFFEEEGRLFVAVLNEGNTLLRLTGTIDLRDDTGRSVATLPFPSGIVLRNGERVFEVETPDDLEPGFFVALALLEDERAGLLAAELPFEVPE